ncbi:hypothetical protein BAE44_0005281 [Dichanthelium oligosanthes]|uniref:DUF4220 domain-containing protein n=1 Tax=Dichanthelium oligosanthes TaxID=888268 RepID=A0A1E5W8W4_9POAL|nr:hypothetical protein BAE44_0005281 [Dichanthelium oligosanthes]
MKMNQVNEYSSSVRNATRAATAWASTPVGLLVRVEVLVTVSCGLLAMQVFLGSGRRTSRSATFRLVVLLALMLCYPAVSYTMGLIQSGSFHNNLVVVWACFLIGCADGIFACSVNHSDQQARTVLNQATQVLYVLLLLVSYIASLDLHLQILLVLLWVLNVTKLGTRLWSMLSAGREQVLTEDTWLISKYMAHDHVRSIWDFDPETMRGYSYVVTGEKHVKEEEEGGFVATAEYKLDVTDDDLITVDRLWQQEQFEGLNKKDDGRLKDLCLSFALFKLLRRRLCGNPLHERHDVRTLLFVKNGLAGGDCYERMYRVIEVELGFLFDFFYSRYPSPKQSLIPETAMFLAALAVSVSTLLSPALMHYHKTQQQQQVMNKGFVTTGLDIWLARFVIVLFLVLELFQYLSLVLSDWHKVKVVCRYARQQQRQQADNKKQQQQQQVLLKRLVLWLMSRATLTTGYWSNSVGQYSLLHACLANQQRSCFGLAGMPLHPWIKGLLTRIRTVTRPNLPVTVKRAIHLFVQSDWMSNLKCGDRTLQRNNMLEVLDWSTTRYRHGGGRVGSILVWHIATTICAADKVNVAGTDAADCPEVATTLSNYCAYLLFHEPELLADQIYEMRRLAQALQHRIQKFLKDQLACRSKDDMFSSLGGFKPHCGRDPEDGCGYEQVILADGIRLAQEIGHHMPHQTLRWKFLSDMWVELLLSSAPSDNVMIHVKKLATGGELITHIWALLTHAGVIDKPKKKK